MEATELNDTQDSIDLCLSSWPRVKVGAGFLAWRAAASASALSFPKQIEIDTLICKTADVSQSLSASQCVPPTIVNKNRDDDSKGSWVHGCFNFQTGLRVGQLFCSSPGRTCSGAKCTYGHAVSQSPPDVTQQNDVVPGMCHFS